MAVDPIRAHFSRSPSVYPPRLLRESTRAAVERHLIAGLASVRLTKATEQSPLPARAAKTTR
jgi:hypothetical protein